MIEAGTCKSYLLETMQAIHNLQTDVIKAALYLSSASINPRDTTAYTAVGEAISAEWVAGGRQLVASAGYPKLDPALGFAVWKFDNMTTPFTTSLTFRGVLLYNSSKANRAICIIDKGIDVVVTNGAIKLFAGVVNPYVIKHAA